MRARRAGRKRDDPARRQDRRTDGSCRTAGVTGPAPVVERRRRGLPARVGQPRRLAPAKVYRGQQHPDQQRSRRPAARRARNGDGERDQRGARRDEVTVRTEERVTGEIGGRQRARRQHERDRRPRSRTPPRGRTSRRTFARPRRRRRPATPTRARARATASRPAPGRWTCRAAARRRPGRRRRRAPPAPREESDAGRRRAEPTRR